MIYMIRHRYKLFLLGWPYGLYGQALLNRQFTLWDKVRYRLLIGEWPEELEGDR